MNFLRICQMTIIHSPGMQKMVLKLSTSLSMGMKVLSLEMQAINTYYNIFILVMSALRSHELRLKKNLMQLSKQRGGRRGCGRGGGRGKRRENVSFKNSINSDSSK